MDVAAHGAHTRGALDMPGRRCVGVEGEDTGRSFTDGGVGGGNVAVEARFHVLAGEIDRLGRHRSGSVVNKSG